jgi:amidase
MKKVSVHQLGIIADMDATAIAEHIRKGDFSVEEVLSSVEEKMHAANPKINAVASYDFKLNKKNFRKGDLFSGVPLFIKDLIHAKGFPTKFGSQGFSDRPAFKNGKGVDQMESMGFITVGKSTTSEFGYTSGCETLVYGDTANPINIDYSSGGSSGGAGALVGAGVVPMAHAMDGGGSIRMPASNCGVIGLKPSRGRILGSISETAPIDPTCDGVHTRTVRDTANFFYGAEKFAPHRKLPKIGQVIGPSARRLKVAFLLETAEKGMPHPDVAKATEQAAKSIERLGHQVEIIRNPFPEQIVQDYRDYLAFLAFMAFHLGKLSWDISFKKEHTLPHTKGLADHFKKVNLNITGVLQRLRILYPAIYTDIFKKYDVMLTPVTAYPVPELGHFGANLDHLIVVKRMIDYMKYTPLHNIIGSPSVSLPMGQCSNGLPIGALFSAATGDEKTLLELAFEIEAAGLLLSHKDYRPSREANSIPI